MQAFTNNTFSPFTVLVELENFVRLLWVQDSIKKNKTFKILK